MRKWSAKRGGWWFAAASVLLHVGWFALFRAAHDAPRERLPRVIELSFESVPAPEPQPSEAERSPVATPVAPTPRAPRPRRERAERPAPAPAPAATVAEVQPSPAEGAAPPSAAAAEAPSPSTLDLSPRRAASTMVDELEVARACRPDAGAASAAACEAPDGVARGQHALNELLRAAANEPEYRTQREPPQLQREGDGGYRYEGHVFSARIRADGRVDFMDGPDVAATGLATAFPGMKGGFDLSDAVEHGMLGKERYSAEKRWFLEQTASLRDRLADAARADEAARARRALELVLQRTVAARELTPEQKRARVLELWEDCGEDGASHATRRAIEAFVRVHMAEGSLLGFSRSELDRFNRGRRGMAEFAPYRRG